jgi:hypothetical protein
MSLLLFSCKFMLADLLIYSKESEIQTGALSHHQLHIHSFLHYHILHPQ